MNRNLSLFCATLAATLTLAPTAHSQSSLQVSVSVNGTSSAVTQGGSVALPASAIGQVALATVTVRYTGGSDAQITALTLTGGAGMTLTGVPAFPVVLVPNATTSFQVQYIPTTGSASTGQVSIIYTENSASNTFTFGVNGTAPSLAFTYFLLPNGTLTGLLPGAQIAFPATNLGSSASAVVNILNAGSAAGSVQSLSVSGADYQIAGGTTPATIQPGQQISFNLVFTPHAAATSSGVLTVGLGNNNNAIFFLSGSGTVPSLSVFYNFADNNVHPLTDGTAIAVPSVDVNGSTTVTINVANQGSGPGTLTNITLSGNGFSLSGLPPLPLTIPSGQTLHFGINFSPTQPGTYTGNFQIVLGTSTISGTLTGSTNPSNLAVSYTLSDGNARQLTDGTIITFPSIDFNATTNAVITILNQGTGTGILNSISVAGVGFSITGSPGLPANIGANQSLKFNITFAPTQAGTFNGTFSINLTGHSYSGSLTASTSPANLTASYALADGNVRPLLDGTIISFPTIDVNSTTTASITILNQGTGTGTLTSLTVTGTGFSISGSPILPANIGVNQNLKFGIVFSPTQAGNYNGTFSIVLGGRSISGTLSASTTTPTLAVSYTLADGIVHSLTDGATIAFPSVDINANTTATITIINQGTGTGTLTNINLTGTGFQLSGAPQLPASIPGNQGIHFGIVFAPTKTGTFTGTFHIDLTGRSITNTLTASTASANFSLSYIDPNTSNVVPLNNNSTLPFPNTVVGSNTTITLQAANTGAGTGSINTIALAGGATSAFQLLSLPPMPLSVPPNQQLRFGVRYSPQQPQSNSDTLSIDLNGQVTAVSLQGQGIQSQFTYGLTSGTTTTPLTPGGAAVIPDTTVGQTTSVSIVISNSGTSDGQIAAISASGSGITLTDLPGLPFTLHPNGSQHFTLNFAPTQPGPISGRLIVGNDTFTLSGNGIGPRLTFAYTSGGSAVSVADTGTVIFPPLAVGSSENLSFTVLNTGTSAATISSINLAAPSTIFTLQQLSTLPINLDPGASLSFSIGFIPNNTGSLTATLRVNSSSFTLSGNGTQPTALPSYQFQAPSSPQPAQQPTLGLTLASPYPLGLQGTLTLTFVSNVFTDDPSIQFATGGRTVSFKIPANTTQALFNGTATSLALQTGTTAGNIVITPAFAMQGGFDLTPSSPTVLTLTIPSAAPLIQSASVTSETLSSFTLVLTGYSTTRSLRQFDIQITPKQGQNFSNTHLTVDVSSAATTWFQGTTSQGFGGSFLVAIPFILSNGSTTDDLVHLLQSLSVTASNTVGASSSVSIPIP